MIKSVGEMTLDEANDMNIPIGIFISEPEESETAWSLRANNYMPRKNHISEAQYDYQADSKEELMELVQKYIVPLYETAVQILKTKGTLYYWDKEKLTNSGET